MARRTHKLVTIGIYSEGTLRPIDMLRAALSALDGVRLTRIENAARRRSRVVSRRYATMRRDAGIDAYDAETLLAYYSDLVEIIEAHSPAYTYWGSSEGDGACIGLWPDVRAVEEDIRYGELASPDTMRAERRAGLAVEISDHGNVTLYRVYKNGNAREIWGVA